MKNQEHYEHIGIRLILMILFWFLFRLSSLVLGFFTVIQWFVVLFKQQPNPKLLGWSRSLVVYIKQTSAYVSFVSNEKPYPFNEFPSEDDVE